MNQPGKRGARRGAGRWLAVALAAGLALAGATAPSLGQQAEEQIALDLASMLRAARTVISTNQGRINDPAIGDKGLTGQVVVDKAAEIYQKSAGADPRAADPATPGGRLLAAQIAAIVEVMDENQATINQPGIGFKGFVPAVFARLVNERFKRKMGREAELKVTAPLDLVRNRKARPDAWETAAIRDSLRRPDWPKGQILTQVATAKGREAFRVLVPEYYGAGCLRCHGEPKGEIDVTGYPKEGGKLGDLAGAISITLYR